MKTWVRRSLNVGVLSAGFLLIGGAAAQADMTTGQNTGVASGNQLSSVLQLPVDVSGNAVAVGGFADASSEGGAWATNGGGATEDMTTGMNGGILSGNQLSNVVQAPISVCGNAIAVLGFADASCVGGAGANNGGGNGGGGGSGGYDESTRAGAQATESMTSGYNAGIASGNQVSNVIQAPISLCGNAISVFGFASAACDGGATANNGGGSPEMTTGFNAGLLSGNQVTNVVQVPISVCGNAIAVLGFADASCVGGATANNGGGNGGPAPTPVDPGTGNPGGGYDGDGDGDGAGYGSGGGAAGGGSHHASGSVSGSASGSTAKAAKANKAVKKAAKSNKVASENSRSRATSNSGSHWSNGSGGASANGGAMTTGYNAGILSGNQLSSVVQLPIDISGNAVAVLGFASAGSIGGAWANN